MAAALSIVAGSVLGQSSPLRPIVLTASDIEEGDAFGCRIPIRIRYDRSPPLTQIRIIGKALHGGRELGSTGIAAGDLPLVLDRGPDGRSYEPVPLQLSLSRPDCRAVDAVRITFARCVFDAKRPAQVCTNLMRFENAHPDRPLLLPLK